MFSAPISSVLLALLIVILQTLTAISALPTSTATTSTIALFALLIIVLQTLTVPPVSILPTNTTPSTSSPLDTRPSSDTNLNYNLNNNNNNDNKNIVNVIPPTDNTNGNNSTASNKATPGQIIGAAIGTLCTIALALALIFWCCFAQHQRRKREIRTANERGATTESTERSGPSYGYSGSVDVGHIV
ncbi:unnamed protein product [Tuber aestivum]|uniref:Uncharacterized protein n=1 Tax=Tuber aestivum TaxID=59557 RepID=A0A292PK26_9PEZI|nr:unnamed protein product [Tuber aestivum]